MNIFLKTFLLFLLCVPVTTFATEIFFDAKGNQFTLGEEFVVSVQVDTQRQSINAIEGTINFPLDLVDIKEVQDGNSVINFWIERPNIYKSGVVRFAGITPGGFSGANNTLFSVVLRATDVGNGAIYGSVIRSFLNDGIGTNIQVKNQSLPIIISNNVTSSFQGDIFVQDTELPESFTPIISNNPEIFNGKYFIVFATQDKASGIDFYKIKEDGSWFFTEESSPYLLKDQGLTKKIYVKAVDKSGNERMEILEAQNVPEPYQNYKIFAILTLVLVVVFLSKKLWRKHTR